MPRKPEYQNFLDQISGRQNDPDPIDEEIPATTQEIGWWKKEQIRRAIHNARYGTPTPVEISLLEKHGIIVSIHAKKRSKRKQR